MIYLVVVAGGIYIVIIGSFLYGWERLKKYAGPERKGNVSISVIIPMRNEGTTLNKLLGALCQQNYPKGLFEIIVIDDHSTDCSLEEAMRWQSNNIIILSLPENVSGKKAAVRYGIDASKGELVVSTDADCYMKNNWLRCLVSYFEENKPVMMLGPIMAATSAESGLFARVQALELFSLLGSTAGAAAIGQPIMCNGANLAFARSVYPEIKYLYDNEKVHSGDDIFALLALKKKYPGRICFIKSMDAVIYTSLPQNLGTFFRQRKRWVAKAKFYKDPAIIIAAVAVFVVNFLLFISLFMGIVMGNFSYFLTLLMMKTAIDFPLLLRVTAFFGQKRLIWWFLLVQSFYFLYVCFTVFAAFISPIKWKDRLIRQ
jgi:cellulose synthase/poly-beta-1,6-N-acetylglucosamine synthase-like glycosyltransferase